MSEEAARGVLLGSGKGSGKKQKPVRAPSVPAFIPVLTPLPVKSPHPPVQSLPQALPEAAPAPVKSHPQPPPAAPYNPSRDPLLQFFNDDRPAGIRQNGYQVITYAFVDSTDATYPEHTSTSHFTERQKKSTLRIFEELERFFKIKLVPAENPDGANLRLLQLEFPEKVKDIQASNQKLIKQGKPPKEYIEGVASTDVHPLTNLQQTDILIRDDAYDDNNYKYGKRGYSLLMHEILHGLGFSHYKNDGKAPGITTDHTVLAYTIGKLKVEGLAPLDLAAGSKYYAFGEGSPSHVDLVKLRKMTVMHAPDHPVTLQGGGKATDGELTIDLNTPYFEDQISGNIKLHGKEYPVGVRRSPATEMNDVLADPNSHIQLNLIGNFNPNILQGGTKDDILRPMYGDDELRGNKGKNSFVFYRDSGFDNIISDFNASPDNQIIIHHGMMSVMLSPCKQISHRGQTYHGTEMRCGYLDDKPLTSCYILGVTPEELNNKILAGRMVDDPYFRVTILPDQSLPPPPIPVTIPAPMAPPLNMQEADPAELLSSPALPHSVSGGMKYEK